MPLNNNFPAPLQHLVHTLQAMREQVQQRLPLTADPPMAPLHFWIGIVLACAAAAAVRMHWLGIFARDPSLTWQGIPIPVNPDAYFYAAQAKDLLAGDSSSLGKLSDLPWVAYGILRLLPFIELEELVAYLVLFLAPLVAIPAALICRTIGLPFIGLLASFLAAAGPAYVLRTMPTYFDTDMLNAVLPMFASAFLIMQTEGGQHLQQPPQQQRSSRSGITARALAPLLRLAGPAQWRQFLLGSAAALCLWAYLAWYAQGIFVATGIVTAYAAALVLAGHWRSSHVLTLLPLIAALLPVPFALPAALLLQALMLGAGRQHLWPMLLVVWTVLLAGLLWLAFGTGLLNTALGYLSSYAGRTAEIAGQDGPRFLSEVGTIAEAQTRPLGASLTLMAGHWLLAIPALLGLLLATLRHATLLTLWPMLLLALSSVSTGVRFTFYGPPVLAPGLAVALAMFGGYLASNSPVLLRAIPDWCGRLIIWAIAAGLCLQFAWGLSPVRNFRYNDIKAFTDLGRVTERQGTVIAWWDYGYPIRYYVGLEPLIHGGLHGGDRNFLVSEVLNTDDQQFAYNLAWLGAWYQETAPEVVPVLKIMEDYGLDSIDELRTRLSGEIELPELETPAYLVMPHSFMEILASVRHFSALDFTTGEKLVDFTYEPPTGIRQQSAGRIVFGSGTTVTGDGKILRRGERPQRLRAVYELVYEDGVIDVTYRPVDPQQRYIVVRHKNYNEYIVMSQNVLDSFVVQASLFDNVRTDLFEPVVQTTEVKAYRLVPPDEREAQSLPETETEAETETDAATETKAEPGPQA